MNKYFSGNSKQRRLAVRRFKRMNATYTVEKMKYSVAGYRVLVSEGVL
jgi:hypothetical protein